MPLFDATSIAPWLSPGAAFLIIAGAVLVGGIAHRLARANGLRRYHALFRATELTAGAVGISELIFAVSFAITGYWLWLGFGISAALVAINLNWLRQAAAGVAIAFEDHFSAGDTVRVGELTGEIEAFDLRAVRIRTDDRRQHSIPNVEFLDRGVAKLTEEGDSACEIHVPLPPGLDVDRARELAREAAMLTPLASPRHEPDVFIETGQAGDSAAHPFGAHVRIRGFASRPAFRDHYRGDVTFRLLQSLEFEASVSQLTEGSADQQVSGATTNRERAADRQSR